MIIEVTENGVWVQNENGRCHFIAASVVTHETLLETTKALKV